MLEDIAQERETRIAQDTGKNEHLARAPPEILYHGTTESYYRNQLRHFGLYRHYFKPVYLTGRLIHALGYAMQRAECYRTRPVLLIIDSVMAIPLREEGWGEWSCSFLQSNGLLSVPLPQGKKFGETEMALIYRKDEHFKKWLQASIYVEEAEYSGLSSSKNP